MVPVGAEAATALEAATATADGPATPPAPLAALLRSVGDRLDHGRGFALLRGLDLDRLQAHGAEATLLIIGTWLGTALPQDASGALVGRLASTAPGPVATASRFHADPADLVALLCLRQPAEGGTVTLVSAPALHNALLKTDRAALGELHGMLPHRPLLGVAPDPRPIFDTTGGRFSGRYDRHALQDAALTAAQHTALVALDAAAAAPGQALSIALHAGDLLLYNPNLVWKQVSSDAGPAPDAIPRALLRLWLARAGSSRLQPAPPGSAGRPGAGPAQRMVGG